MHRRRRLAPAERVPRTRANRRSALAARALIVLACALVAVVPSRHPAAAAPARYPGLFENVTADLGVFWAGQFSAAGLAYADPGVQIVGTTVSSGCGPMSASSIGAYCPADRTIYLSGPAGNDMISRYGDFAWVVVVSHEWGHHIQHLLAITPGTGPDFELQADCLAGAYAKDAEARGLLADNDLSEGVGVSASAGDPPWLPKDSPGAHGTNDQRVKALMTGDINGVGACGIAPLGSVAVMPQPANAASVPAVAPVPAPGTVPAAIFLPQGQVFRVEQQGAEAMDAGLAQFGWTSGEYRIFASDNPPPGAAGWVEIHRLHFGSVAGASQALAFLAQNRAATNGLAPLGPAGIGDESAAMSGPAYNGTEYTVYVRSGADLLRVTGISPSGVPSQDVIAAALQALAG